MFAVTTEPAADTITVHKLSILTDGMVSMTGSQNCNTVSVMVYTDELIIIRDHIVNLLQSMGLGYTDAE